MALKPYKGVIVGEQRFYPDVKNDPAYGRNLGYLIVGRFNGHPQFGNSVGHTSLIVKKGRWKANDEGDKYCEVETLNSRYLWTKP